MPDLVCAVDVGTGSARAGIVDRRGGLLGRGERPISLNRPNGVDAEHDSEAVWQAVCAAVVAARQAAGVPADRVAGISFDATCSLVVRDRHGAPLSVSTTGEARWDTIAWLDHRALAEADECTATGHPVLDHLGGVMSAEMQTPKLMWLKRRLPHTWQHAGHFFDLADFLTWKASGSLARSQCTLVAKWTYLAHAGGWQPDFFAAVGLDDVFERGALPAVAAPPGSDLGPLTPAAAASLGLTTACRVGAGLIDAFAGALGVLGGHTDNADWLSRQLALVAGTSSCLMSLSPRPLRFAGGWGPYLGTTLPSLWMTEGGQSATGALLDHIVRWHAAGGEPDVALHRKIAGRVAELRAAEPDLAPRLHVLPDFHGNRAPLADPYALGVVSGLTLDASFDSLCRLYWRTAVAITLGIRHIVDTIRAGGDAVDALHITGGHTRNPLLMELYPDATGCAVIEPLADEAVLRGTAAAAAVAAGLYSGIAEAAAAMRQESRRRLPDPAARRRLDRDYRIFQEMQRQRRTLDALA